METLKIHHRLLVFLTASLALACVISPWMSLGADWVAAQWPAVLSERVPFSRVFNRSFMVAAFVLFFIYRRLLIPDEMKYLLKPGRSVAARNFSIGWALAIGSMVLLGAVMSITDVFTPYFRLSLSRSVSRIASALASGVAVGFIEEVFFRGILFLGLLRHGHPARAYLFANIYYSALHFVKPGEDYFLQGVDIFAGFRHLPLTLEPFTNAAILPGIFGLFLIGVVFSYALVRTGNLYLSIGLHAGWIFSLKVFRVFGNFTRQDLGWAFGSTEPKIVSGVITWIGILLVALAIHRITQRHPAASGPPPAKAV
jgi:uncharacterized protein